MLSATNFSISSTRTHVNITIFFPWPEPVWVEFGYTDFDLNLRQEYSIKLIKIKFNVQSNSSYTAFLTPKYSLQGEGSTL